MKNKTLRGIFVLIIAICILTGFNRGSRADSKTEIFETGEIMRFCVNDKELDVLWEDNESVNAIRELVSKKPLNIKMSMYGGFEQVGSIGRELPRNDKHTTTNAGDIVLYSGNQIVVFYGSNSWSYTRLGHIKNKTAKELREILGRENVTVTISISNAR